MANNLLEWCVEHVTEWKWGDHDIICQDACGGIYIFGTYDDFAKTDTFIDWETDLVTKQEWERARVK